MAISIRTTVATIAAAAVMGVGGVVVSQGGNTEPTPSSIPADLANLWVDSDGGTCARTAGAEYASASACASLDAAQDAAQAGDTVRIKNATYGAQDITGSKGSTVTYIGESKASVIFTSTVNLETNVTLKDVTIASDSHSFWPINADSTSNVSIVNVDASGDYVRQYLYGVTNFSWRGGYVGDNDGTINKRHCSGSATPDGEPWWVGSNSNGVLIEDVHMSSALPSENNENGCPSNDNFHLEIFRIDDASTDVTLRRNIFDNNGSNSSTIFLSNFGDGPPTNIKIIGNMIGSAPAGAISMQSFACSNYTVAYNSFRATWGTINCSSYSNFKMVGNLLEHPGFGTPTCANVIWTSNVWQAASDPGCNTGDDSGNVWVSDNGGSGVSELDYVDSTDQHIQASSPAIDAAETPSASDMCTDTSIMGDLEDVDGDVRPIGSKCDAGADEYE